MNKKKYTYIGSFLVQAMAMDIERNLLLLVWFVCITTIYFHVLFTTVLTIVEVLLVQYTDLIRYVGSGAFLF